MSTTSKLGTALITGASAVRVQAVLPGATRTALWNGSGVELKDLPSEIVMDVDEMVDAALAGFDQGERITLPSLPDAADWQRLVKARDDLQPNLSRKHSAPRYKIPLLSGTIRQGDGTPPHFCSFKYAIISARFCASLT